MYYFRAIPNFELIKLFISTIFFNNDNNIINHLETKNFSYFLFSRSRDAMNFLIEKHFIKLNRKIEFLIPNLFCWEIISQFNKKHVNISFYELDENFEIKSLPIENVDFLLYVDLFGIKKDIKELRDKCKQRKITLFIDQAHCTKLSRKPFENEFIFLSFYKHYPIYDGAALVINNINKKEISQDYKNLKLKKHSKVDMLFWLLKSIYISLNLRMKYLKNDYDFTTKIENIENINYFRMSNVSIKIINREYSSLENLKNPYSFYSEIAKLFSRKFKCSLINESYSNSHLFALRFENPENALKVYEIFKKIKLPVVTWPEKKFINNIPVDINQNAIKIIDKLLFIPSFYNNYISNNKKNRILKSIQKQIDEN
jgi:dTDP-4-amino-4,6-dideoxygalactose transaminase